jgi:hypothetical protein
MLFGLIPSTLKVGSRLSDPPIVTDGSTVLIFHIGNLAHDHTPPQTSPSRHVDGVPGHMRGALPSTVFANPLVPPLPPNPKFLGDFKLSKFDGTARQWKAWNKSFTRYLSIHQLDYVLESGFLDLLQFSRDAFTANKMVFYILEDAIVQSLGP